MSTIFDNFGRHSIGVAISDTRLYAAVPSPSGRTTTYEWALEPLPRMAADWPSLATALSDLRLKVPKSYQSITVALLPPEVQIRRIELPKLSGAPLRQLLSRTAGRYFPNVREPNTVGSMILGRSSPAPYIVAAAASRTVELIVRIAREASWDIATIVPAHTAWVTAATRRWAALRKNTGEVAVPFDGHYEVLQLKTGKLVGTRRFRPEDLPASARAHILEQPEYTAAAEAVEAQGLEILPEVEYVRRAVARRKLLIRSGLGVAAAFLLIAGGVLLHARRELNQVMEERAALRASIAQVTGAQNDIAALTGPISALKRIETNAPVWADVFVDMGSNLPRDAHILNFRATGDSVTAEGLAVRGATVFDAMNGAVLIDSIRSAGPIRRQIRPGAKPMDQFTLTARVIDAAALHTARPNARGTRLP